MNNYCRHCGEKLEANVTVCPKCSAEVIEARVNIEEKKKEIDEQKKKAKKYVLIMALFYALAYLIDYYKELFEGSFIYNLRSLFPLMAIITLIYARVTLKQSKLIRVLFGILLTLTILYILFFLFILITCMAFMNSGCS